MCLDINFRFDENLTINREIFKQEIFKQIKIDEKVFWEFTYHDEHGDKKCVIGGHFPSVKTPEEYEKKFKELIGMFDLSKNNKYCLFGDLQGRWIFPDKKNTSQISDIWYEKSLHQLWHGTYKLQDSRDIVNTDNFIENWNESDYNIKDIKIEPAILDQYKIEYQSKLKSSSTYLFEKDQNFELTETKTKKNRLKRGTPTTTFITRAGWCDFAFYTKEFSDNLDVHKLEIEDSRNHFDFLKEADHKPIYFEDDNFIFVSMNLGGLVLGGIHKTIIKTIKKTIKSLKKS